jgi:hypothetical protein
MAKNKISDYSATPANNTDINNIDIAEGCSPSGINNAIRELMADLKDWQAGSESGQALAVASGGTGGETAAAARTNLSAAQSGANSDITSLSGLTTPLSVAQGGTGIQVTRTISNVALTSNVVTITTSAAHGYLVNDSVTVTATTQTTVNGTYIIASVPTSTTFTYAKTASDIPSTSDTGSVVSSSYIKLANASGILPVVNGGTGLATLTANNVMLGNGTSTPSFVAPSTSGNVLVSNGTTWQSGTYTPAALSTASGSAPSYSARAWARFNATSSADLSATYSQSGTTVTVTATSHGLYVGNKVYINITSGTGVDGTYTVSSVANDNTFTYTAGTSLTTLGTASLQFRTVDGAGNIGRVSYIAEGRYVINFVTAMPDANYVLNGNSGELGSFNAGTNSVISIVETNTGCVLIQNSDPSANSFRDYSYNSIQVLR